MTTNPTNDRFSEIEEEIQKLRREADEHSARFLDAYDGKTDNTNVFAGIGLLVVVLLSVMHVAFGILGGMVYCLYLYSVHVRNTELKARVHETLARIDNLRDEQERL